MATPILSHSISQFQLGRYATLANQIEALKAEPIGATVEAGARSASLKTCERRSVSWRSVVERLKGTGYASRILSCTKPTTYTKLVVS